MKNQSLISLTLISTLMLSGCFAGAPDFPTFKMATKWENAETAEPLFMNAKAENLHNWWENFGDPTLNTLVETALEKSPDRRAAQARILEARGLERSQRSFLFPQVGGSASKGRDKTSQSSAADVFDARLDASYEIDIFGVNRNRFTASQKQLSSLEAEYQDISLTLVAEVARTYIEMRGSEKQAQIAKTNVELQEKTLELIEVLKEYGEGPQLDVARAKSLVNATRSTIPEFERVAENARLRLALLVGIVPEELIDMTAGAANIPGSDVAPVLMAPGTILTMRPDIRAASYNLAAQTDLAEAETASIFPTFSLSGFFGVTETGFADTTQIWSIALGAAVAILDFGRIEGRIDAARAREMQAFELFRKTVLSAVNDVETALNDYSKMNEQSVLLMKSYQNAEQAFGYSQDLFKEGEVAFLDVLDAQRTVNDAETALISAEMNRASALIRLYKSLGVAPKN